VSGLLKQLENGEPVIDSIPEPLVLKRDYSDALSMHQEKQRQHIEKIVKVLEGRLKHRESADESVEHRRRIDEHNQAINSRADDKSARKELKGKYLKKLQLRHGENYMNLFADEMSEEADRMVEEELGPSPKDPHAVDLSESKKENEAKKARRNAEREKTSEKVREFHRSFNKPTPEELEQKRNEEIREKIDYDFVDANRQYLDSREANTADILKEFPVESELKGKTSDERRALLPESYWQEIHKDPNAPTSLYWEWIESDRIDKDAAEKWLNDLRAAGVPMEIISDFPASYFYRDGDPEETDDLPESFIEWRNQNPGIKIGPNGNGDAHIEASPSEADAERERKIARAQVMLDNAAASAVASNDGDVSPKGWKAWFKDRLNREAAVTFNKSDPRTGKKIGDASVNTELAGVDIDRKTVVVAVGALAVTAGSILAAKYGGLNPFDMFNGSEADTGTTTAPEADPTPPETEGTRSESSPEVSDSETPDSTQETDLPEGFEPVISAENPTPSHVAYDLLKAEGVLNPSIGQIHDKTQELLDLNNMDWPDAKKLQPGFRLRIK